MAYYYNDQGDKVPVDDHSTPEEKAKALAQQQKDQGYGQPAPYWVPVNGAAVPTSNGGPAPPTQLDANGFPVSNDLPDPNSPEGKAYQQRLDDAKAAQQAAADKAAFDANNARINNAYEYGGTPGGAAASSNYFNGQAIGDQTRKGEVIDYTNANGDRANNLQDRAGEQSVAEAMRQRALGNQPTIASLEGTQNIGRMMAAQSSTAAGARGPAALALAQQQQAANEANGISTINNQTEINSANEKRADEVAAFGAQNTIRTGDQSLQGQDAQQGLSQAQINAAQRAQNDAASQANYQNAIGINEFQSGAQQNRVNAEHGVYYANQNLTQQQHDSGRADLSTALGAVGTGAAVVGTVLGAATLGSSKGGSSGPINGSTGGNNSPGGGGGNPGGGNPSNSPGDGYYAPDGTWINGGSNVQSNTSTKGVGGSFGGGYGFGTEAGTTAAPTLANTGSTGSGIGGGTLSMGNGASPATAPKTPAAGTGTLGISTGGPAPAAGTTAKSKPLGGIFSDVRIKDGIESEGRHPLEQGNRVDAFLDGIHPLSYTYKDPSQEPRSQPTGGRYLGISAQDLERVPDVGHQLVSEGPRGKQLETGPTLSAAMAGVARLNERLKAVEAPHAQARVSSERGEYFADQALKQRQHDSGREDFAQGAHIVGAGAGTLGTVLVSDMRAKGDVVAEGAAPTAATAWDQGHAATIANIDKVSKMTPEQLAASPHPEAAAVRGIKANAWDEGHAAGQASILRTQKAAPSHSLPEYPYAWGPAPRGYTQGLPQGAPREPVSFEREHATPDGGVYRRDRGDAAPTIASLDKGGR